MKALLNFASQRKVLALCASLFFAFNIFFKIKDGELKAIHAENKALDPTFGYTPEDINNAFQNFGEKGHWIHDQIRIADSFYPIVYTLLFLGVFQLIFDKTKWEKLSLLLFLPACFDYIENVFLFLLSKSKIKPTEKLSSSSKFLYNWKMVIGPNLFSDFNIRIPKQKIN